MTSWGTGSEHPRKITVHAHLPKGDGKATLKREKLGHGTMPYEPR